MKRLLLIATALIAAGCAETTTPYGTRPFATAPIAAQSVPAVREAQLELRRLGYYSGSADGVWGPETQMAVERFQRDRRLDATGQLNADTSAALRSAARSAAVMPPAVPAVREAQLELRRLGYYSGGADGLWGPETQIAVERFQRDRRLAVTGQLTADTSAALRSATRPVAAIPPPPAPMPDLDATTVRTVQNRLKQLNVYEGPADGVWGPATQIAIERFQRSQGLAADGQLGAQTLEAMGLHARDFQTARAASLGEPLDPPVIRVVQQRLRANGYYAGGIDGVWGPGTQSALERFQRARGLQPTGELNPTTVSALGLDPNNLTASAAAPRGGYGGGWRR